MKAEKIRNSDAAELGRQMEETQEQLFRLRFQMGMGQTDGLKKYRLLRKDRARLLTVMREKGIAAEVSTPTPPMAGPAVTGKEKKAKKK